MRHDSVTIYSTTAAIQRNLARSAPPILLLTHQPSAFVLALLSFPAEFLLSRDTRVVERKKYGQKKARKRFTFVKR